MGPESPHKLQLVLPLRVLVLRPSIPHVFLPVKSFTLELLVSTVSQSNNLLLLGHLPFKLSHKVVITLGFSHCGGKFDPLKLANKRLLTRFHALAEINLGLHARRLLVAEVRLVNRLDARKLRRRFYFELSGVSF